MNQKRCKKTLTNLVEYSQSEIDQRRTYLRTVILPMVGPALEGLTDDVIGAMVDAYDDMLFNGYIKRRLQKLQWKVKHRAHFTKKEALFEADSAAFLCYTTSDKGPDEIGLVFNKEALTKIEQGGKCAFKKLCTSVFDCFMDVFEHELIHLVHFVACEYTRSTGRHDRVFMAMARRWFGQHSATHSLW